MIVCGLWDNEKDGTKHIEFRCPGCKISHKVTFERPEDKPGPRWTWNGSLEFPTFMPSIHCRYKKTGYVEEICHSFVKDGNIQYLSDCTHELAGQTVPLPAWGD